MKKLSVRIGEYQGQDGQMKGRYQNIGVLMQKDDGKEYVLLDPSVSIAGLMALQQADAMKKGEPLRDRVLAGVFEDQPQQGGYQQQPAQQQSYAQNQAPPQQQYAQQQAMPHQSVNDHNQGPF